MGVQILSLPLYRIILLQMGINEQWQKKKKNNEDVTSSGSSTRPEKVIHEVLTYSAIGSDFRKMVEKERGALVKLYDIAH